MNAAACAAQQRAERAVAPHIAEPGKEAALALLVLGLHLRQRTRQREHGRDHDERRRVAEQRGLDAEARDHEPAERGAAPRPRP